MKDIILYDGECFLCNSFINYVINNDNSHYYFIDQRSSKFNEYRTKYNLENKLNTIFLIQQNKIYLESKAIELILKKCGTLGRFISFFLQLFPNFISDYFYKLIAENRFILFKKKCIIPNKKINSRTL